MKSPVIPRPTIDVTSEFEKSVKALLELRDAVQLEVHQGGLEAKHDWSLLRARLEATLAQAATSSSDATRSAVVDVTNAVRRVRDTLV